MAITIANKMKYVRLDVGSTLHLCHRDTLLMYPDSALAKYVAPEFDRRESENDFIIIDRDGKHFGAILNYMRDPSSLGLKLWQSADLRELKSEADFYCLTELLEEVERELDVKESDNYKAPQRFQITTLVREEDVETFVRLSQKPTFLVNSRAIVKIKGFDAGNFVEHVDQDRFNLIFTPCPIRFDKCGDSSILILCILSGGIRTDEFYPPMRGSLGDIYSYILRCQVSDIPQNLSKT